MRPFLLAMLCGLLLCLPLPAPAAAEPVQLYVCPTLGDDTASGGEAAPLRTLHAAIDAVRAARPGDGAVIWLRGGVHRLQSTLALDFRGKSGITFRAFPGETPVVTGDTPVSGWMAVQRNGQTLWAAPVDAKAIRAVYGAHGALQNARWPKTGHLQVDRPIKDVTSNFVGQKSFFADPQALPDTLDGAYVRLLHLWKDELSGVRRYDAQTGRISLNRNTSLTIRAGNPFWLENVLSAPLEPGEWAFDAEARMLYYAPLPGEDTAATTLYAGTLETLLTAEGLSGLHFEGITFARTGWNIPLGDARADFAQAAYDVFPAIHISGGRDIRFTDCTFEDIGAGCIHLGSGVRDAVIERCAFTRVGAQAIYVRGRNTSGSDATRSLRIENNHIDGYGRSFLNAAAILIIHASDMDIRNNEIHDGTYSAISAGWVWGTGFSATDDLRICDNLIYDIGKGLLSDMGGIYTLGVQKKTVISGNIIHGVRAGDYGGWGIYLDEGARGILVESNLVYGCSSQGFHQHDGIQSMVRGNIFAYNGQGQVGISDKRRKGTFRLEGNLLIGGEPYFWHKYGVETIDVGENLYYADDAPLFDLYGAHFLLADDPAFARVGFVPWENRAGRRADTDIAH